MEQKTVSITGRDIATKISVDPNPQTISQGPNEGSSYFRARFDGKGFIVTEEFLAKWQAGDIAEVNLTPSTYDVDDPMNPDQKIKRESWQLSAYATFDQVDKIEAKLAARQLAAKRQEVELSKMDLDLEITRTKALAELKLDDATVGKLAGAI